MKLSGKVIANNLDEIPGVRIYDTDSTLLATSELDGTFEISLESTDVLFGALGMESERIAISEDCGPLEVILIYDVLYHHNSHRKIDRLRRRDFDERNSLHQQAFERGIFSNNSPCFQYEFVPSKPQLDEIQDWMNQRKIQIKKEFKKLMIGDTILVPYSRSSTNAVYSSYSDHREYECLVTGSVLMKDQKKGGLNVSYIVLALDQCGYSSLTHNDKPVEVGDTLRHNMKYFRLLKVEPGNP